jgi:8-oxo-dGTP pyrophosphatase MutT (NUDIX family)
VKLYELSIKRKQIVKLSDLFEKKTTKTSWVILFTSNKLILGKRAPSVKNPNLWNFFGGHIDEGESAAEAAARELEEESKLKVDPSKMKKIAEIGDATYFSLKVESGSASTTPEVSKVKEFKLTDLPDNLHSKTENFFNQLETLLQ